MSRKYILLSDKNHIGTTNNNNLYYQYYLIGPDIYRVIVEMETFFPNIKLMERANFIRKYLVKYGNLKYAYSYSVKNLRKSFMKIKFENNKYLVQD